MNELRILTVFVDYFQMIYVQIVGAAILVTSLEQTDWRWVILFWPVIGNKRYHAQTNSCCKEY